MLSFSPLRQATNRTMGSQADPFWHTRNSSGSVKKETYSSRSDSHRSSSDHQPQHAVSLYAYGKVSGSQKRDWSQALMSRT
jgi:hypothetical protein